MQMQLGHWILDKDQKPVKATLMEWAKWFQGNKGKDRIIEQTTVGDAEVSTVFLGLDHNFSEVGPPLLFETMIFGGVHGEYQERYSTVEDAKEGHAIAVLLVTTKLKLVKGDG